MFKKHGRFLLDIFKFIDKRTYSLSETFLCKKCYPN